MLQDTVPPFRYDTAHLLRALNESVAELRRVRPDLFLARGNLRVAVPQYQLPQDEETELPFRMSVILPLLLFVVGRVQLREAEGESLARAAQFLQSAMAALTKAP